MTQDMASQKRGDGVLSGVTRDDEELMHDPEAMDSAYSGYEPDGGKRRYYAPGEGRAHLSALFADRSAAESAVHRLEMLGVPPADISLVVRDAAEPVSDTLSDDLSVGAQHPHTRAGEAAGSGSIVGGTVGAVLGAIAAAATAIALPGIGIIIAGPIAGALAGAGAGSLTGGLLGALVGAGIPEEAARTYEQGVHSGGVLVVADVPTHLAVQAQDVLTR